MLPNMENTLSRKDQIRKLREVLQARRSSSQRVERAEEPEQPTPTPKPVPDPTHKRKKTKISQTQEAGGNTDHFMFIFVKKVDMEMYVVVELFAQLEEIGVTDDQNTMLDKVQPPPTASKTCYMLLFFIVVLPYLYLFCVVLVTRSNLKVSSEKIKVANAVHEGKNIGVGLFLRSGISVEPGEVLTEYPGQPRWIPPQTEESHNDGYEFRVGPLRVRDNVGKEHVRFLVWDCFDVHDTQNMRYVAHKVNTFHPRSLDEKYRTQNCTWGIDVWNLELKLHVEPAAKLYLVAGIAMSVPLRSKSPIQLLADYHWFLAEELGIGCGDRECTLCCDGLCKFYP